MTLRDTHTSDKPLLYRLDPRGKLFSLLIVAFQLFAFSSPANLIFVSLVVVAGVVVARLPVRLLWKRATSVSFFVVLICLVHAFTISGEILFEFKGIYITREGILQGVSLSARIVLLLVVAAVFVQTTPITDMIDCIETTLRPFRKRFGALAQVLTLALNFVPMFIQSAHQIKKAQIARGAEPDRNLLRQIRFAFSAVIPLFAMSLRSSEHLAYAMESRCYEPWGERSSFANPQFNTNDMLVAGFVTCQFLVVAIFIA